MLKELRQRVLVAAKKLREYDLIVMAGGTVAARDSETGLVVITPSGMEYDDLTWEDMTVIDAALNKVDGARKQSVCSDMFMEIFKARSDIGAVCHSHSRYATAFACCNMQIPVITTTQGNLVGGPVPCTHWVHPDPHEPAYLRDIVETIGFGFACNIRNHGPVVCGRTVEEAIENIITVEVTAQTTYIARQLGNPDYLSEEETLRAYQFCKSSVGQG
ncbi:MAG: class II aldolase/adducin family protein [Eubacteriales bacterium]|nr:class II aldolase/adducin family protein [Eubacteriales bacterium]